MQMATVMCAKRRRMATFPRYTLRSNKDTQYTVLHTQVGQHTAEDRRDTSLHIPNINRSNIRRHPNQNRDNRVKQQVIAIQHEVHKSRQQVTAQPVYTTYRRPLAHRVASVQQ